MDILGVWIGEHESSKFWLSVLNDLKSRGVDVYLFCTDGLCGMQEAIQEGLNRQFRQITKNKPSFTSDDSLRRMLYLAAQRIVKHWKSRCQNWDLVLSQLQLMFAGRAAG